MNKNKKEEIIDLGGDLSNISEMFGINQNVNNSKDEYKFFGELSDTFFNIKDENGLSKTDVSSWLVLGLSMLIDYSENTLPLYNDYLKEKLSLEDYEDQKVSIPVIVDFLLKIYIQILVSKDRKGRMEGTEISKAFTDFLKSKAGMGDQGFNKMVKDLSQ